MASLEAALQLAKSQSGLGLTAVVQRVLRSKDTFVFSELLDLPQVQALERDPTYKPTFDLLALFVGGSYAEFKARRAELPGVDALLDAPLLEKLKLLSLVGLASSRKVIPYDDLRAALDLATDSDVEGVVIAAVYSGLLHARLDQRSRTVEVSHCAGRDVRGADGAYLQDLLAKLTAWSATIGTVQDALHETMEGLVAQRDATRRVRDAHAKQVEDGRKAAEQEQDRRGVEGVLAASARYYSGGAGPSGGGGGGGGRGLLDVLGGGGGELAGAAGGDAAAGAYDEGAGMELDDDAGGGEGGDPAARRRPKRRMPPNTRDNGGGGARGAAASRRM